MRIYYFVTLVNLFKDALNILIVSNIVNEIIITVELTLIIFTWLLEHMSPVQWHSVISLCSGKKHSCYHQLYRNCKTN